jgi:rare lipoprotein A
MSWFDVGTTLKKTQPGSFQLFMNPAISVANPRPAPAGLAQTPFLQILKRIVLLFATAELLLSCQTERRKPPEPPSVPVMESFAPAPQWRAIKASDLLLKDLSVDPDGTWIPNEGSTRKYEAQVGKVSYYHEPQKMADGDHFDPTDMTAAHRKLPLQTIVRCTNLENGKSVVVVVRDRGPYEDGRILDLSRAAGRKIGLSKEGIERCRVEVLAYPAKEKEARNTK